MGGREGNRRGRDANSYSDKQKKRAARDKWGGERLREKGRERDPTADEMAIWSWDSLSSQTPLLLSLSCCLFPCRPPPTPPSLHPHRLAKPLTPYRDTCRPGCPTPPNAPYPPPPSLGPEPEPGADATC